MITDDDIPEILERATKQALEDGVINERDYTVFQYRTPFPGYERETQRQTGKRLEVDHKRILQLEWKTFRKIMPYVEKLL